MYERKPKTYEEGGCLFSFLGIIFMIFFVYFVILEGYKNHMHQY